MKQLFDALIVAAILAAPWVIYFGWMMLPAY